MNDQPTQHPLYHKVEARHVLSATHELRRLGPVRLTQALEQRQPDVLEHALEGLTQLHRDLLNSGLPPRTTRSLYRQAQSLVLTSVRAYGIRDGVDVFEHPD